MMSDVSKNIKKKAQWINIYLDLNGTVDKLPELKKTFSVLSVHTAVLFRELKEIYQ